MHEITLIAQVAMTFPSPVPANLGGDPRDANASSELIRAVTPMLARERGWRVAHRIAVGVTGVEVGAVGRAASGAVRGTAVVVRYQLVLRVLELRVLVLRVLMLMLVRRAVAIHAIAFLRVLGSFRVVRGLPCRTVRRVATGGVIHGCRVHVCGGRGSRLGTHVVLKGALLVQAIAFRDPVSTMLHCHGRADVQEAAGSSVPAKPFGPMATSQTGVPARHVVLLHVTGARRAWEVVCRLHVDRRLGFWFPSYFVFVLEMLNLLLQANLVLECSCFILILLELTL